MDKQVLDIIIKLKDEVSDKLEQIGKSGKATSQGLSTAFKGMALGGAAAFTTIAAFGVKAVQAYNESELSAVQLKHAVKDISKATDAQFESTKNLINELAKKGVIDDDNLAMGVAQLSTFGLSNDLVQKLTGSMADLAVNQFGVTVSGDQMVQTANMMAKALNGQFGILEKSGIRFTESQQAMILHGNETQRASALQEGFAQNLRFTNEEAMKTAQGIQQNLANSMGNLQERLGQGLQPIMLKFLETIVPVVESVAKWIEKNPVLFDQLLVGSLIFTGLVTVLGVLGTVITNLTVLTALLGITMTLGLGIAFIAVGAAITFLAVTFIKHFQGMQWMVGIFVYNVKTYWGAMVANISQAWDGAWNGIKGTFTGIMDFIGGMIKSYINSWIGLINGIIGGANKVGGALGAGSIGLVPTLATGGMITGSGIAQVHAGEYIMPKDQVNQVYNNGNTVNVNANVSSNVDINLLAYQLSYAIRT